MKVFFKSKDSNGNKVSFVSNLTKDDNNLRFKDISANNTIISIDLLDDELMFNREGDVFTSIHFILDEKTKAKYKNSLGLEFDFEVLTTYLAIKDNEVYVSYQMILDGDTISNHEISLLIK